MSPLDFEWALHYAYRVARARKLGRDDAREIASSTVTRLLEAYAPESITLQLVGTTARNLVRNWYRDNAPRIEFEQDTVPMDEARDAALDTTTQVETRVDLERALGALAPETRELVVASVLHGKTSRELAKERGTNHVQIQRELQHALGQLRQTLGESDYS